ncbi:Hypothetical predicted protein, partial [Marmota monax]
MAEIQHVLGFFCRERGTARISAGVTRRSSGTQGPVPTSRGPHHRASLLASRHLPLDVETECCAVLEAGLKLEMFLPQPPESRGSRSVPPHLAHTGHLVVACV